MSSLWTPGGERPIRREPDASEPSGESGGRGPVGPGGDTEPTPDEMRAEMAELQEQLARTPANVVIANHAFGLFELAALHLSQQPPQLDQARLAIDAMAAVVEGLGDRLGEYASQLADGLSQLRMAYVQISTAQQGQRGGSDASGGSGDSGKGAAGD
jgi:hypothetical protein